MSYLKVLMISTAFLLGACTAKTDSILELSENDRIEIICKKVEVTGSRLKQKLCGTKDMWEERSKASKEELSRMEQEMRNIQDSELLKYGEGGL